MEKATIQAGLLSGRYRLEALSVHWVPWDMQGMCSLPLCWGTNKAHKGTIEAFLLSCPSLSNTRATLWEFKENYLSDNPDLLSLVTQCVMCDPVQFWLDCHKLYQQLRNVMKV